MAAEGNFFSDGQAYDRLMGRCSRAVGEVFLDWLSVPEGLAWLDVGCGTGAFTELVIERAAPLRVSAIDPAEAQIEYARTRPGAKEVTFRVGDGQSLPFTDHEFDVAAMALVIQFVPDPVKAIAELKRVIRPGGVVATYTWDTRDGGYMQKPLRNALRAMNVDVPDLPGAANSLPDNLKSCFEKAGLESIEARTIEVSVSYDDFDDFWTAETGLANPLVQAVQKMPATDVKRLKEYLEKNLLPTKDGRISYPARANAIKGLVR